MVQKEMNKILYKNKILLMVSVFMCEGDRKEIKQTEIIKQFNELNDDDTYTNPYTRRLLKQFNEIYGFLNTSKRGRFRRYKIKKEYIPLFKKAYDFYEELIM